MPPIAKVVGVSVGSIIASIMGMSLRSGNMRIPIIIKALLVPFFFVKCIS